MPTQALCPLCGDVTGEVVEIEENKAGNPYFNCNTLASSVNLRPKKGVPDDAEVVLSQAIDAADTDETLAQSDEGSDESADEQTDDSSHAETLSDLLNDND